MIIKKPLKKLIRHEILNFSRSFGLSARETEVLKLPLKGKSYYKIGKILFISKATVKTHINKIYRKTGAANKMDLANRILD